MSENLESAMGQEQEAPAAAPTQEVDASQDADALYEKVMGGEVGETTGPADPGLQVKKDVPIWPKDGSQEVEFTWNGKTIKAPVDKVTKWAQQGYDYSQKMQEFKSLQAKLEEEKTGLESEYSPYKKLDEYAKQNPEWWQSVVESYQAAQQGELPSEGDQAVDPKFEELKSELDQLKEFKLNLEAQQQAQLEAQEDQQLTSEITSIRQDNPDLDWSSLDENGYSLEQRVLAHAQQNQINSFRAAFRDYNHDRLIGLAQEKGKAVVGETLKQRSKLGLLGETQAPTQGIQPAQGVKEKSYEDILNEAKGELGIA